MTRPQTKASATRAFILYLVSGNLVALVSRSGHSKRVAELANTSVVNWWYSVLKHWRTLRNWTHMDPNRIIQALKGTIDPNLRITAENELNQVCESGVHFALFMWVWHEWVANGPFMASYWNRCLCLWKAVCLSTRPLQHTLTNVPHFITVIATEIGVPWHNTQRTHICGQLISSYWTLFIRYICEL